MEEEKAGKEAYEAIKEEKLKRKEKQGQEQKSKKQKGKFVTYLITLIVLFLLGFGFYLLVQRELPKTEDMSRAVPVMSDRSHVPIGTAVEYNSNPPTSGPHYNQPARPGFREGESIADGHIIHSLEHGLVWLSYSPSVSEEVVEALREFDTGLVVIAERAANESDIALAVWGRLDTFDVGERLADEEKQRISDFITRYVNKGPERIPAGSHGGI